MTFLTWKTEAFHFGAQFSVYNYQPENRTKFYAYLWIARRVFKLTNEY